jgi:selenocysteine lyase/cysteine desulfurase
LELGKMKIRKGNKVQGKKIDEVIEVFDMSIAGWDCDMDGYLVLVAGTKKLVFTNHGSPYFGTIEEMEKLLKQRQKNANDLRNKIEELRVIIR